MPADVRGFGDLRHSFAVRTLFGWYRDGADVDALLPRLSTYLGHVDPSVDLLVPDRRPRTDGPRRLDRLDRHDEGAAPVTSLAPSCKAFFTERLYRQLNASAHTVRSYRDTFRLLLDYAHQHDRQDTIGSWISLTSTRR